VLPALPLEDVAFWQEGRGVNATEIRDKRQTTLPAAIAEAAGLKPGDQVQWRFENGEIRGRKVQPQNVRRMTKAEARSAIKNSPLKFSRFWDQIKADTREP
jgi:bifunctional DNA-binding transcriptional regulator/antitoxin component of YhaV-PrlF toxin-antitoxin module